MYNSGQIKSLQKNSFIKDLKFSITEIKEVIQSWKEKTIWELY